MKPLACLALAGALSAGCGYHVAGRADMLPRDVRTIAVPAFANATTRYRLTQSLPAAITREFLARTRYRVVAGDEEADAVLLGSVTNYMSYPITFDPATGRAAGVQHSVALAVRLVEKKTGKELYGNPNLVAQSRYEVSTDTEAYFDESETSLERLSRDVARTVVSAILESF